MNISVMIFDPPCLFHHTASPAINCRMRGKSCERIEPIIKIKNSFVCSFLLKNRGCEQSNHSKIPNCFLFSHWYLLSSFTLQFKNKVGEGFFCGKSLPTYVYPHCLKMAVREMVGGELKDYQDPEGSAVSIFLFQSFLYIFPILPVVVLYFLCGWTCLVLEKLI